MKIHGTAITILKDKAKEIEVNLADARKDVSRFELAVSTAKRMRDELVRQLDDVDTAIVDLEEVTF
jgi:septal ring factor EnvC (AmiA/AmiB activator)